jgi:ribosomal protein S18 acetylase RimI-like enzyme
MGNVSPPELSCRTATPADVTAIVELVESAYRGESSRAGWTTEADLLDGRRTDASAVTDIITGSHSLMLVASSLHGDLVGCCQLERRPGGVCYFGSFAVSPGLQGAGIGGRLLEEAERLARQEWVCASMEMTVIEQRDDLIAWYLRRGYTVSGDTRPFPYGDARFGVPRREDLRFAVLVKLL